MERMSAGERRGEWERERECKKDVWMVVLAW